jgi:hypothetical protein
MIRYLLLVGLLLGSIFVNNHLKAQQFYNFEEFFEDTAFIQSNGIKTVTLRIPNLTNDTSSEALAVQRLCYNPYGKLGQYEYNLYTNQPHRGYVEHFYNDGAQRFKSHSYKRGADGRDSLREVVVYHHDETGKVYLEEHHQIYISEFNEWTIGYEWFGDSLRVQYAPDSRIDSVRYDANRHIVEYTQSGWRYRNFYDNEGKKTHMLRFFMTDEAKEGSEVGQYEYIYDNRGRLTRIETIGREIIFEYGDLGLPVSSYQRDRTTGKQLGFQVFFEYELR